MKYLFPVKHGSFNISSVCKSVVEEQWNTIPTTTLKQNHNDRRLIPRRKWCCYQSEMINNAKRKLWDSNPSSHRLRSEAVKRAPRFAPPSCGIMSLACRHSCGLPQSPNPRVTTTAFLLPRGNPQFQKGTESKQKAISVAEPWKETNSQDLEFFTESQDFLICREKQQEQLKVSNRVQLLSSRVWWNINKFHIRASAQVRGCLFVLGNTAFIFVEDVIKAHFKKLPLAPSSLFDYMLAHSPARDIEPLSWSLWLEDNQKHYLPLTTPTHYDATSINCGSYKK